ncbi:unnamed protein product, partial [Agarophyton chilense]
MKRAGAGMVALCLSLGAALRAAAAAASAQANARDMGRDMQPAQIPGLYENVALPPYSAACPDFVRVQQVEPVLSPLGVLYVIPHQFISVPFSGGGAQTCAASATTSKYTAASATILRRSADVPLDTNNSLVAAFVAAREAFFLGQEAGDRVCGALLTTGGSVSMWVAPQRVVQAQAGRGFRINFRQGFKYVYYFANGAGSAPCLLRGDGAEQAQVVAVATPSASPSAR